VLSWPIWLKFIVGFGVAVTLPTLLVIILGINSVNEVSLQSIKSYMLESGTRQRQALVSTLNQLSDQLSQYTANNITRRTLLDVLSADPTQPIPPETAQASIRQFTNLRTQNPALASSEFWLMTTNATVLQVIASGAANVAAGNDLSNTDLFKAIQSPGTLTRDQRLVVTHDMDAPHIFIVSRLNRFLDGRVAGYLVTQLDLDKIIYQNLTFSDTTLPAYAFLVSQDGTLFAAPNDLAQARESAQSAGVQRALQGRREVDTYPVGANLDRPVIGYYSPLSMQDEQFALVAEVDQNAQFQQLVASVGRVSFPIAVGVSSLVVVLALLFNQLFTPSLQQLTDAIRKMGAGNLNTPLPSANRGDELGAVSAAFIDMREQVRVLIDDLAKRMTERVRDVEATQEISRYAASQRDLQTLLDRVVTLITDRFPNIYHAQIFLVDTDRQYAILRASTGEVGKELLKRGHRLAVGSLSVIGRVSEEGQVLVTRDTASSTVHRRNELLPETRAEAAIPLRLGANIIGVLDVQTRQAGSFTDDQINVLQTMADQITVAIENARLYQESLRRLEEIETSNRLATRRAWEEYLASQRVKDLSSQVGIDDTSSDRSALREQAVRDGKPAVGTLTPRQTIPVAVPIQLRGQTLGAVEWELPASDFDANKVLLAQELVARLAISLDNARLFQESRRAVERERLVNSIAAKLSQQTGIDDILQTAVREVGQALRAPQVNIRLQWNQNGNQDANGGSENGTQSNGG
jgi:GAF domain-containing protein/HAMP domain-containing protein